MDAIVMDPIVTRVRRDFAGFDIDTFLAGYQEIWLPVYLVASRRPISMACVELPGRPWPDGMRRIAWSRSSSLDWSERQISMPRGIAAANERFVGGAYTWRRDRRVTDARGTSKGRGIG